jgi:uracil phosphoribosyltransferase
MGGVTVVDHPLVQHKLALLRDARTGPKEFRELLAEVSFLLAYEATRDLATRGAEVRTPLAPAAVRVLAERVAVVPVLRAGLGMLEGVLRLVPNARVGHVGLQRDHRTLQPVPYYRRLPPDLPECRALLVDPMLATGGSAVAAVRMLKEEGARGVTLMCLVAAPQGLAAVAAAHPDVPVITAAVDSHLDARGYIVPGLGDAGDRLFGTG